MNWYPNITLEQWLTIYPELNCFLPLACPCGKELVSMPCVSKHWIGLISNECTCSQKKSYRVGFPKNLDDKKVSEELATFLYT